MEPTNELKLFTVEEANQLIPSLKKSVLDLQSKKQELMRREVEIDAHEIIAEPSEKPSPVLERLIKEYENTVNEFYALIDAIHQFGGLLKDVDLGLVDFYSVHDGRVIYLSWCLGEDEISSWHDIGRGYSHREPLNKDFWK